MAAACGRLPSTAAQNGATDDSVAEQPLLTGNQCEAQKTRELRALLLEIPQEDEDPMQFSLGIKTGGAMLRFKIPFSFSSAPPPLRRLRRLQHHDRFARALTAFCG